MELYQAYTNLILLLLLVVMCIGTMVSDMVGLGLLIGATIVTFWNIARKT